GPLASRRGAELRQTDRRRRAGRGAQAPGGDRSLSGRGIAGPTVQILEYSLIGVASGSMYVLAALGFVIIFKSTNIFNFAMGEMMMFGAYLFFAATVQLQLGWPIGLVLALAGSIVAAIVIERGLLQPLLGQPAI